MFQGSAYKRSKNRVHVKNMYYRKLNLLGNLQLEVNTLEMQYEKLLDVYRQRDAQSASQLQIDFDHSSRNSNSTLSKAYVNLLLMKSALTRENSELRRVNEKNILMEKKIRQLIMVQDKEMSLQHGIQERNKNKPSLRMNPLTPEQYSKIVKDSYREIKAFRESKTCTSSGLRIFGWTDRHDVNEEQLMFSLDKLFSGLSLEEMAEGLWQILSDTEVLQTLKQSDADVHFHVVERPNENAVVFYYTLERRDSDQRVRAFILSTRIDLGSQGSLIIFRTLDPSTFLKHDEDGRRGRKRIEPHKETVWLNAFVWSICEFARDQQNDCRLTYGGKMNSTALATASWWYIYMLQSIMIMETRVTRSRRFLL
ncbi:Hypothetical protein PHPALM_15249 [Phytophthora palmivora]|uniref:Uncharacterized protein n=1 Tax=Phytophthora palmivora TaxID=4796 RepID=A0A2P4XSN3_9STRA|nr:Hypothetical protein PHPALM_15249 [Phytophthora palmivora]